MITIKIEGDAALLQDGLNTFAQAYGWTAQITENEVLIDNPVTAQDFSKVIVGNYFKDVIKAEKAKAADVLRTQILEASETALSAVGLTIS